MNVYVCLYEFVCTLCVQCLWRPDKGIGAIGTEVTGGFDQYHMDWEFNGTLVSKSS